MELIERAGLLDLLQTKFDSIASGEGHCILISAEAGMGKTSLVRAFCKEKQDEARIYQGTCDALFTPRPLAPLHDIIWQLRSDIWEEGGHITDRDALFTRFFQELGRQKDTIVVVFEDIHWADEATLDFIKFLARRITRVRCLFILTYRDDEIHSSHPLRNVLGQLPPDSFTRLQLPPLSRQAVEKMSIERGYSGEDVYTISGGNPFYVNEILASYSPGVPDNIKDSILSVYNHLDERTRQVWQALSVIPTGLELKYLERMEPAYPDAIGNCMESKILIVRNGSIHFKHELYRRTIETALSPLMRVALNKRILELFLDAFAANHETERIIHHAKNANEYDLVVQYAPIAARQAAAVGAHIEASKLYFTAIEYYQESDKDKLVEFYELYAYECYLTSRVREAVIYQARALAILKEKKDMEKTGNCLRFLSRLWWFDGNRKHAENYANEAIEVLKDKPASPAKAMALSNMAQLKMLSDNREECVFWGEQAIAMANELNDEETLCHALNNVGTVQVRSIATREAGARMLQQSLDIALKNSFHEHAARAYTNEASTAVEIRDYATARQAFEAGILYCEERDLDSWSAYMLSLKSRYLFETGEWNEALRIAENLIHKEDQVSIVKIGALVVVASIRMRRGEPDALPLLLEAKTRAFDAMELQRILPVLTALLEYEWITGRNYIEPESFNKAMDMLHHMNPEYFNHRFAFWLMKTRRQHVPLSKDPEDKTVNRKPAIFWKEAGCPYEQAIALFDGNEADKRTAIRIIQKLGAAAIYEKMKLEMRSSGIRSIPRGLRKTTQSNAALLTERELDVLLLLKEGLQNKEIAARLFISPKTVDHHISAILFKLDVNSRVKAVQEALLQQIIK